MPSVNHSQEAAQQGCLHGEVHRRLPRVDSNEVVNQHGIASKVGSFRRPQLTAALNGSGNRRSTGTKLSRASP